MSRITWTIAILFTALLLAPAASAQGSASITLRLEPFEGPLTPGERALLRGHVEYTADWTAHSGLIGVPVQYSVDEAPSWMSVSIMPAVDILQPSQSPGWSTYAAAPVLLVIDVAKNATTWETGVLAIKVHAAKTMLGASATSIGSTPVTVGEAAAPCGAGGVQTHSAEVTPFVPPTMSAIGAFIALAAAVIGFRIARTRRVNAGAIIMVALIALTFIAPAASAQASMAGIIRSEVQEDYMAPGETVILKGLVRLVYDPIAGAHPSGTTLHYSIERAPDWATVTIIDFDPLVYPAPGTSEAYGEFTYAVTAHGDVQESQIGPAEIQVEMNNGFVRGTSTIAVPLGVHVPVVCHDGGQPHAVVEPEAPVRTDDVSVQTAQAKPLSAAPIVAACAIIGALVGVALARRLK